MQLEAQKAAWKVCSLFRCQLCALTYCGHNILMTVAGGSVLLQGTRFEEHENRNVRAQRSCRCVYVHSAKDGFL
jgi:hypothetical protein